MEVLHHQARPHDPNRVSYDVTDDSRSNSRIQSGPGLWVALPCEVMLGVFEKREEKRVKDGNGDHIGAIS